MSNVSLRTVAAAVLLGAALLCMPRSAPASGTSVRRPVDAVRQIADATVSELMARDGIPGMAIGIAVNGRSYVFHYGVASKSPRRPVTRDTLFELGSLSKTFTATMAAWAQTQHRLSLTDPTDRELPQFSGTPFGNVSLISLGTHTPGGFPLQVPANVTSEAALTRYLKAWRPKYKAGTYRTYSNVSIGMLGIIAAKSLGGDFSQVAQTRLFPALGLTHTFIDIPDDNLRDYAWGYRDDGKPVRMTRGILWQEAYGVRTTASDMVRFLEENIDPAGLPSALGRAMMQTHTGYFSARPMVQDLIWEQYPYPVPLASLQEGNAYRMIFTATPVRSIEPPQPPNANVWLNKTGSTSGFGSYAAFIPAKRVGIVLLANKNYPIRDRVSAAYRMLHGLTSLTPAH